jgi:hypothetical protein
MMVNVRIIQACCCWAENKGRKDVLYPPREVSVALGVHVTPDSPALPRKWADDADHVLQNLLKMGKL